MKNTQMATLIEQSNHIHPDTLAMLQHFPFSRLPVEGALYFSTWFSDQRMEQETPVGTAMIGMYCEHPHSASIFHRLHYDEVWHFYSGDPFRLILLHPDGTSETIQMGCNPLNGDTVQYVIPASTWQAGEIIPGGRYALFGCTMAPGFDGSVFEAGITAELIRQYPDREADIRRLSINTGEIHMPGGYTV